MPEKSCDRCRFVREEPWTGGKTAIRCGKTGRVTELIPEGMDYHGILSPRPEWCKEVP